MLLVPVFVLGKNNKKANPSRAAKRRPAFSWPCSWATRSLPFTDGPVQGQTGQGTGWWHISLLSQVLLAGMLQGFSCTAWAASFKEPALEHLPPNSRHGGQTRIGSRSPATGPEKGVKDFCLQEVQKFTLKVVGVTGIIWHSYWHNPPIP